MVSLLLSPLSYSFMQRGMAAAILVGILCSIVGCYVVLRSMAFLGDAVAHAILPGVAIAYLLNSSLTTGALIAAILVALGIGILTRQGNIKEDTAIGILFTAALALGVALISTIRTYAMDLSHILFGNILGVTQGDLWLTAALSVVVLGAIVILYRPFLIISFDPILAATLRLRISLLNNLLMILLAITIVIALQTVGIGLVAAMLVTPPATAFLLTRRLVPMMFLSAMIGVFSSVAGLYFSFYWNIASGAAIVLTATLVFVLVFLFAPHRGLIWQKIQKRSAL
ncbi:MAG: metal ABC transporter permease [Anaerolineaceae bacterium]|nr:metal ABC transporter permease [Anaerolineaceae bacterium]